MNMAIRPDGTEIAVGIASKTLLFSIKGADSITSPKRRGTPKSPKATVKSAIDFNILHLGVQVLTLSQLIQLIILLH